MKKISGIQEKRKYDPELEEKSTNKFSSRYERNDRCRRQKAIANIFHIFKNVEETINIIRRKMEDFKKTKMALLTTVPEIKIYWSRINRILDKAEEKMSSLEDSNIN